MEAAKERKSYQTMEGQSYNEGWCPRHGIQHFEVGGMFDNIEDFKFLVQRENPDGATFRLNCGCSWAWDSHPERKGAIPEQKCVFNSDDLISMDDVADVQGLKSLGDYYDSDIEEAALDEQEKVIDEWIEPECGICHDTGVYYEGFGLERHAAQCQCWRWKLAGKELEAKMKADRDKGQEISLEVLPVAPPYAVSEDCDPDGSTPYHIRGSWDKGKSEMRFLVLDNSGNLQVIILRNCDPALGHPKEYDCCGKAWKEVGDA